MRFNVRSTGFFSRGRSTGPLRTCRAGHTSKKHAQHGAGVRCHMTRQALPRVSAEGTCPPSLANCTRSSWRAEGRLRQEFVAARAGRPTRAALGPKSTSLSSDA